MFYVCTHGTTPTLLLFGWALRFRLDFDTKPREAEEEDNRPPRTMGGDHVWRTWGEYEVERTTISESQ